MNKRVALIILISILIVLAGFLYYYFNRGGEYELSIERSYETAEEKEAINIAEGLNYTHFIKFPRFNEDWSPNFIDKSIISHHRNITNDAKDEKKELDIYYNYYATAKYYDEFNVTIENNYSQLNISINENDKMNIYHEGYGIFYSNILVVLKILRGIDEVDPTDSEFFGISRFEGVYQYNQNLSKMYLVEMYLSYREVYSSTSDSITEIFQIVILDADYNVSMIILFPPHESTGT
jgi:hypothetical protein